MQTLRIVLAGAMAAQSVEAYLFKTMLDRRTLNTLAQQMQAGLKATFEWNANLHTIKSLCTDAPDAKDTNPYELAAIQKHLEWDIAHEQNQEKQQAAAATLQFMNMLTAHHNIHTTTAKRDIDTLVQTLHHDLAFLQHPRLQNKEDWLMFSMNCSGSTMAEYTAILQHAQQRIELGDITATPQQATLVDSGLSQIEQFVIHRGWKNHHDESLYDQYTNTALDHLARNLSYLAPYQNDMLDSEEGTSADFNSLILHQIPSLQNADRTPNPIEKIFVVMMQAQSDPAVSPYNQHCLKPCIEFLSNYFDECDMHQTGFWQRVDKIAQQSSDLNNLICSLHTNAAQAQN